MYSRLATEFFSLPPFLVRDALLPVLSSSALGGPSGFGLCPNPSLSSSPLFSLGGMVILASPLLRPSQPGKISANCGWKRKLLGFLIEDCGKAKKCEVVEVESEPFQDQEECDTPHEASSTNKGKEKESTTPASKKQKRAKGQGIRISG